MQKISCLYDVGGNRVFDFFFFLEHSTNVLLNYSTKEFSGYNHISEV